MAFRTRSNRRILALNAVQQITIDIVVEHSGGLTTTKHVIVPEQVAIFLSIIAHHKKNCVVKHDFLRSGRTVSKHFHAILNTIYKITHIFLAKAIPIADDCADPRWRWFKGCLGAFDGTFIDVRVLEIEKGRYRTRKGQVAVNVLGVCNPNMQFIYVLFGWEGSAADSRVLRDAIHQPHGFRVPSGNYYLCDNGYANADGFLTPYRRVRWGILRSQSFYPVETENKIIFVCCLLHNFLRNEMLDDPFELEIPDEANACVDANVECIASIDTTTAWTTWRDQLATSMYNEWLSRP
ncbi:UNVERIFIED_CONTAM: hypothetical protein Sradi_3578300 [Sesamum radiatum]|uniref:DDE Tnp4 domain-containing protein n=1 Tax=Sesamum radiatum TaxID=300843 RepID=A0AAW2QGA5_SESRA